MYVTIQARLFLYVIKSFFSLYCNSFIVKVVVERMVFPNFGIRYLRNNDQK
ncbi:hypothetical protein FTV88_2355 [Heliorestis convoluta]|uniref:Uncharacterized protein n=1 Tax=Heliorestis convoluta TaxID=356322 RepID=A0A5Q2N3K6_9FIRM|nr:hypothetical protein FTV88_2355 [Heliorestis convoluta]